VEDIPILGRTDDRRIFQDFAATYDAPAYVRRARQVEDAYQGLLARCRKQRDEWIKMVRLRLGTLAALAAGDWARLRPWLTDKQTNALRVLHDEVAPRLRLPVEPATSDRPLRRGLLEVRESIERFNRRWEEFVSTLDLAEINRLRDGYNRYYLVEKECAVRSYRLAGANFHKLPPLTLDDVLAAFPLLPVLQITGEPN
jgi:hypothetical protein